MFRFFCLSGICKHVKVLSKAERAYKCHITRVQDSANTGGKVNMKGTMEMLVLVGLKMLIMLDWMPASA